MNRYKIKKTINYNEMTTEYFIMERFALILWTYVGEASRLLHVSCIAYKTKEEAQDRIDEMLEYRKLH